MAEKTWEAGPELDAEIARRVLGMDVKLVTEDEEREFPCQLRNVEHRRVRDFRIWSPLRPYSTDVGAAMLVFEALVEMTGSGGLWADMEDARGEGFVVSVTFGFDDAVTATAPLPLAVCRAALAVLDAANPARGAGDAGAGEAGT